MEWNTDITSIPYDEEVLLKVEDETHYLCEKVGCGLPDSGFIIIGTEDFLEDEDIISWCSLVEINIMMENYSKFNTLLMFIQSLQLSVADESKRDEIICTIQGGNTL